MSLWEEDYLTLQKDRGLFSKPALRPRKLTDDERVALRLMENPHWEALMRVVQERAGRAKSRIYRENLSNQELELGKLLGSLEALEWVAKLPGTLLDILSKEKNDGKS